MGRDSKSNLNSIDAKLAPQKSALNCFPSQPQTGSLNPGALDPGNKFDRRGIFCPHILLIEIVDEIRHFNKDVVDDTFGE